MRQVSILFVLLLSFVVSGFAQERTLTMKNIRFHTLSAHQGDKVVIVDEFTADIYKPSDNDIVRVKVIPCEPTIEFPYDENKPEAIATVGMVTVTSEKKIPRGYVVAITFDLTDGDVTFPCLYSLGTRFSFLHRTSKEEIILRNAKDSYRVKLLQETQRTFGATVGGSFRVSLSKIKDRTETAPDRQKIGERTSIRKERP